MQWEAVVPFYIPKNKNKNKKICDDKNPCFVVDFFFFTQVVQAPASPSYSAQSSWTRFHLWPGGFANSGDGHGWGPRIALECNLQAYFTQTPPLDRPTLVHRILLVFVVLVLKRVRDIIISYIFDTTFSKLWFLSQMSLISSMNKIGLGFSGLINNWG